MQPTVTRSGRACDLPGSPNAKALANVLEARLGVLSLKEDDEVASPLGMHRESPLAPRLRSALLAGLCLLRCGAGSVTRQHRVVNVCFAGPVVLWSRGPMSYYAFPACNWR